MENVPGGARARHREQVRAEIQAHAWEQIADAGPSAVSLRAIAKQMGMTAPALYRYFTSRDDLLTSLILATYQELAEIVEATVSTNDPPEHRLRRIAAEVRRWATSSPGRYLLAHGTPFPGYAVPPEATNLTHRIFTPARSAFMDLEIQHAAATRERLPSSAGVPDVTTVVVSSVRVGPCADPSRSGRAGTEC